MSFPVIVETHKTYYLHGMNPKRFYDIIIGWASAGWPGEVRFGDLEIDALMRHPWDVHGRISSLDNEIAHYSGSLLDIRHVEILKLDIHIESFVNAPAFWDAVELILARVCAEDMLEREKREEGISEQQVNAGRDRPLGRHRAGIRAQTPHRADDRSA